MSGLIPARAGKTLRRSRLRRPSRAHPRAGGENAADLTFDERPRGSSPRGRGKLAAAGVPIRLIGLIPARAGKTPSTASLSTSRPAHPRAGGEN